MCARKGRMVSCTADVISEYCLHNSLQCSMVVLKLGQRYWQKCAAEQLNSTQRLQGFSTSFLS